MRGDRGVGGGSVCYGGLAVGGVAGGGERGYVGGEGRVASYYVVMDGKTV